MTSRPQQLALPFACIDFPDRTTVSAGEIAAKLGVTVQHVLDHIFLQKLNAVDTGLGDSRRNPRIPVDEYRRWILSMLTAPERKTFFAELPRATLEQMHREIGALLAS